jgi:hypothetical protein
MKLYREWASKKNCRGRMVEEHIIPKLVKTQYNPGYEGVYSFPKEVADTVNETKSVKGLSKHEAYSNRLIIDIDDSDPDKAMQRTLALEYMLDSRDIGFETWFSGGNGYHVVVKHELIGSIDLPYSQRNYVEKALGVEADLSIYQHGRLVSLPGRVHEKTGKKKKLLSVKQGELIQLELVKKPELQVNFSDLGISDLEKALMNLQFLAMAPPGEGTRWNSLWGTATDLARAGLPYDTVLNLLQVINNKWPKPTTQDYVQKAVEKAFLQLFGAL